MPISRRTNANNAIHCSRRTVRAKAYLTETGNQKWIDRLTAPHGQRRVFHFRQPGGGYDRNIRLEKSLVEIVDYIHANAVRRGLVATPTDWVWSSARFWDGTGRGRF